MSAAILLGNTRRTVGQLLKLSPFLYNYFMFIIQYDNGDTLLERATTDSMKSDYMPLVKATDSKNRACHPYG
jgi:hypothetical protein